MDESFIIEQKRVGNQLSKIYVILLGEIGDFPNHLFEVRLDEDIDQFAWIVEDCGGIVS